MQDIEDAAESDQALVERTAAGDREAFAALYRRHQGAVYRFARLMTGSPSAAEDIVQEVFLVLMKDASRYEGAGGADNLPVRRGETRHAAPAAAGTPLRAHDCGRRRHAGTSRRTPALAARCANSFAAPSCRCRPAIGRSSFSAICRESPTKRRRPLSAALLEPSDRGCIGRDGSLQPKCRADGAHGVARAVMVCGMTSHDDHLAALVDALRDAESGDAAAHVEAAVMRAWDASHAVHTPARLSTVSQFASLAAGAVTRPV